MLRGSRRILRSFSIYEQDLPTFFREPIGGTDRWTVQGLRCRPFGARGKVSGNRPLSLSPLSLSRPPLPSVTFCPSLPSLLSLLSYLFSLLSLRLTTPLIHPLVRPSVLVCLFVLLFPRLSLFLLGRRLSASLFISEIFPHTPFRTPHLSTGISAHSSSHL